MATYLEKAAEARASLLERVAESIREQLPGINVTVVAGDGVIRFRSDDLFKSGQWRVHPGSPAALVAAAVANALTDALPCCTYGDHAHMEPCDSVRIGIETIQIEGHTDSVPIGAGLREREGVLDNLDLAARRGSEMLRSVNRGRPELNGFLNHRGERVLSFAGYGAMRPIDRRDPTSAVNRRIDIRFMLQTPQNMEEVSEIRRLLTQGLSDLPTIADEGEPHECG